METAGDRARNAASAERRADIVAAARELYEEQGLSKTSVQDITNRVGVTRSLFYHYFPDKEAVTSAVLDDYVADFIEATHYWNAQRHPGDIESALASVVKLMRLGVFEHDAFRRSLASRENAALYASETSPETIGTVTSGGFGPTLNAPVAMGYLPTSLSADGTIVFADVRGRRLPLRVAPMPFVPNGYKR